MGVMAVGHAGWDLTLVALVGATLQCPALRAQAGLEPEAVGVVLRLGAPGANGLRGYGMGNAMTASTDQSYNPAMVVRDEPSVAFRHGWTWCDDADDTSFRIGLAEATVPLSGCDALKVLYLEVDSGEEATSLLPIPGSTKEITGKHLGLAYGRRINERLSLGVSGAVLLNSDISLRCPPGTEVAHVSGRAGYDGVRLGAAYQVTDALQLAAQYDFFTVRAELVDNVTPARVRKDLRLSDFVSGIEWKPQEQWSVVAELETGRVSARGYRKRIDGLRTGVEYRASDRLALRLGLADGNPTGGIGYEDGTWSAGLAWMRDLYEDELGPTFGSSDTIYLSVGRSL